MAAEAFSVSGCGSPWLFQPAALGQMANKWQHHWMLQDLVEVFEQENQESVPDGLHTWRTKKDWEDTAYRQEAGSAGTLVQPGGWFSREAGVLWPLRASRG